MITKSKTKFNRLKNSVLDCKAIFPSYVANCKSALGLIVDINDYIREKCPECDIKSFRQLDEIRRDISICQSRLDWLVTKLQECHTSIAYTEAYLKRRQKGNAKRLTDCIQLLTSWINFRSDFHKSFRVAEKKWCDMENDILNRIGESNEG